MKYLILSIFVLFISCSDYQSEDNFHVLEYKGHSYIYYKKMGSYSCGFVHNPDCKCLLKDSLWAK